MSLATPEALNKSLPILASALFAVLIAYVLVKFVWLFAGAEEMINEDVQLPAGATAQVSNRSEQYANHIQELHLFGFADLSLQSQAANAPETQLNLKLLGVLAIGTEGGMAIIGSGNSEQVYTVGETVPGNVVLKAVYLSHVLLQSSRGLETLRLPEEDGAYIEFKPQSTQSGSSQARQDGGSAPAQSAVMAPAAAPPGRGAEPGAAQNLRDLRREFIRNPASLAEYAQAEPVDNGYRLTFVQDNPMVQKLGLQNGDVVTSINGIPLDKPENGIRALRKLMKAREVQLTVVRNGQEQQLTSPLE
ncbi:MAG TPA: type II secretion system protein N [Gammaproteobacteria bacterium]|nr:type II secretion system protein N [Gammaproteobacteria bacterium]